MLGPPPHAEAQPAIHTFVHSDGVKILAVISTLQTDTGSQRPSGLTRIHLGNNSVLGLNGFPKRPHHPQES